VNPFEAMLPGSKAASPFTQGVHPRIQKALADFRFGLRAESPAPQAPDRYQFLFW
jgi:hypothetical protein